MRIPFPGKIINALVIKLVNPHLPVRVNNLLLAQHNADMDNPPFGIVEKGQVAGLGKGGEMYLLAHRHLLPGIPGQGIPTDAIHLLHKPGAVDAENRFTAP